MHCIILSPESKQEFEGVQSIILPAFSGELQILPNHAESFISLRQGEIILESGKPKVIPVEGGIGEIKNNIVTIIL